MGWWCAGGVQRLARTPICHVASGLWRGAPATCGSAVRLCSWGGGRGCGWWRARRSLLMPPHNAAPPPPPQTPPGVAMEHADFSSLGAAAMAHVPQRPKPLGLGGGVVAGKPLKEVRVRVWGPAAAVACACACAQRAAAAAAAAVATSFACCLACCLACCFACCLLLHCLQGGEILCRCGGLVCLRQRQGRLAAAQCLLPPPPSPLPHR